MTTPRTHKHLTAWIGLLAMWLIVLAPMVSHLVQAGQGLVLPVCSVASDGGPRPVVGDHVDLGEDQGDQHADLLSACGYCNLLEHHAAAPAVPPVAPLVTPLLLLVLVAPLAVGFTPAEAFPSGRPRDPPPHS